MDQCWVAMEDMQGRIDQGRGESQATQMRAQRTFERGGDRAGRWRIAMVLCMRAVHTELNRRSLMRRQRLDGHDRRMEHAGQ